jgi:CubicO group peptidase (beta-lactamase class C family)
MTEADPDDIGPDGSVRLRCYLATANSLWFAAGCQGQQGCGHSAPIGIRAAIALMGPEATVGGARAAPAMQPVRQPPGGRHGPARHPHGRGYRARWAGAGNADRAWRLSRFRQRAPQMLLD